MISNKKRAIIVTLVLSLVVGTLINAKSWYMLLNNGCENESVYTENIQNFETSELDNVNEVKDTDNDDKYVKDEDGFEYEIEYISSENNDYTVYDEDYNIVVEDNTNIKNMSTLGGLGMNNNIVSVNCDDSMMDNGGIQQVGTKKLKKAIKATGYEVKLLACIINAEAKGEPYAGKLGVANVVLNRYRSKGFPNSIKKVIYQKSQFGPVKNGALNRELRKYGEGHYKKNAAAKSSLKAAKEALNGRYVIGKYDFNKKLYFNGKRYSRARKNNIIIKNHRFW